MSNLQIFMFLFSIITSSKFANSKFPQDFQFGVATSPYQIEGGWNQDGKGYSMWDEASHNMTYLVDDQSNGDIACDSYHKWQEDIELVKDLGVTSYRFGISWTRVFPDGYITKTNPAGVKYYNNIINELLKNGIEPMVTLYHWDLPKAFGSTGGWNNPAIVQLFADYSKKIFKLFGDRVKKWITLNEPRLICNYFKGRVGDIPRKYVNGLSEYVCARNIIRAHAEAYHIYDKEFRPTQKGTIGITLDMPWYEPLNSSNPLDVEAAQQILEFEIGLYANPIYHYGYPKVVIDRIAKLGREKGYSESKLPKLSQEEKHRIKGTSDFLGINHYLVFLVRGRNDSNPNVLSIDPDAEGVRLMDPSWPPSGYEYFKIVPWALRQILKWVKHKYNDPEVIVTENGFCDDKEIIDDFERIKYFKGYINATYQAIVEDKVNVKYYILWTLLDDFEWMWGYTKKFGLFHVNFTDPNRPRTPKKSVQYLKKVIKDRAVF